MLLVHRTNFRISMWMKEPCLSRPTNWEAKRAFLMININLTYQPHSMRCGNNEKTCRHEQSSGDTSGLQLFDEGDIHRSC